MKVFMSWSGEPSRTIARELSAWLRGIIQAVEPWMSDDEIGSGKRWRDEIGTALNETDFGIVCVTNANQHQPWIMFESGALAKHLEFAHVIPLCIDLDTTDVAGPLSDWQARKLDREGMYRVVSDINSATPKPLPKESLSNLFELLWPGLETAVSAAKERLPVTSQPERPAREILEELLERVRRIERITDSKTDAGDLLKYVNGLSAKEVRWLRLMLLHGLRQGDSGIDDIVMNSESPEKWTYLQVKTFNDSTKPDQSTA